METEKPIKLWKKLLEAPDLSDSELKEGLKHIYRDNPPKVVEIVVNPHCSNNCKHCIYSKVYHEHNKTLETQQWERILKILYNEFGYRKFIFGGRELNKTIISLIKFLKESFGDVHVGTIADGPSIKRYYSDFQNLELDNLDISLDGMENIHDLQRDFKGSFKTTIEQIERLKKDPKIKIKKISILSCFTTLNKESIFEMIKYLNGELEILNFFISPMVTGINGGPDKKLKPSYEDIGNFIKDLMRFFGSLKNSYISINFFDESFLNYLKKDEELYKKIKPLETSLGFSLHNKDNEFHFEYSPISLSGCNEFIINSDGNIFTGVVVSEGPIPQENIFGNALDLKDKNKFFESRLNSKAFEFYVKHLKELRENLSS